MTTHTRDNRRVYDKVVLVKDTTRAGCSCAALVLHFKAFVKVSPDVLVVCQGTQRAVLFPFKEYAIAGHLRFFSRCDAFSWSSVLLRPDFFLQSTDLSRLWMSTLRFGGRVSAALIFSSWQVSVPRIMSGSVSYNFSGFAFSVHLAR